MSLRIACFRVNISAEVGQRLCGGLVPDAKSFRDPHYARGLILDDGRKRLVLCAVDYCEIGGTLYDQWRTRLARAAGTTARHVALHTVHQHDAPLLRTCAMAAAAQNDLVVFDRDWWKRVSRRLTAGVRKAARRFDNVVEIGSARARVSKAASNRRILGRNGRVIGVRYSVCRDGKVRRAPVGLIDPWMRSLTFWGKRQRLLATVSYYGSHPQCSAWRGIVSADAPGEALRLVERKFPRAFHCYFTGCEGDVTFGKYSTLKLGQNLRVFGARLAAGMTKAIEASRRNRAANLTLGWRAVRFAIPFRLQNSVASWRAMLRDKAKSAYERAVGSLGLGGVRERARFRRQLMIGLAIGNHRVIHLPGEPFIEYQLWGQRLRPRDFVAFAGLGDGAVGYLPTARAFKEGGYETSPMACYTTPQIERILKNAIEKAIR